MHTITYYSMISIGSDKAPVSLKWIPNVDIQIDPLTTALDVFVPMEQCTFYFLDPF